VDISEGNCNIDLSGGGWMRNNFFVRLMYQNNVPALSMKGNPNDLESSYGNLVLWSNFLGITIFVNNLQSSLFHECVFF